MKLSYRLNLFTLLFAVLCVSVKAATYYSKGNLPVNLASSWSSTADGSGASPASLNGSNTWIIQGGDSMTLTGNTTLALSTAILRIENGGIFMNATTSSSVNIGTFQMYGGAVYYHNTGTVPMPGVTKQLANSTNGGQGNGTVLVQNYPNGTAVSGVYGNLIITHVNTSIWNHSGTLTGVDGDFTLNSPSALAFRLGSGSNTFTVGGNFHLLSGLFQVSNNTVGTYAINIGGAFYQSGGTFVPNTNTSTVSINFTGPGNTINLAGGTFTNTLVNWNVNTGAELSLLSDLPVSASRTVTIDGALACGANRITGAGSVSVSSTGTIRIGSLSPSGALADNVTATLNTLPAGSAIEYNGTGAQFETSQSFQKLIVSNIAGLTLNAGNTLQLKGDFVNNGMVLGDGKIILNSNVVAQNIIGNGSVGNLEIDNPNGVVIASSSNIAITQSLTVSAGTFTTNDALVLKSTSVAATARVHPLGATAAIIGKATVERFIPAKRAWRLLTAPVKGAVNNSVFYNWQHNGGAGDGTGLEIWGPGGTGESGNGLASTIAGTYSLRNYNGSSNTWSSVTNTQTEPLFTSTINKGLLTFVSGPYNSGNISTGATTTILKAKGELITGEQTYNFADNLALVGNPYAAPINFDDVWSNSGNLNLARQFWVVDPNLNDVGGYVLVMHNGSGYSITPSGGGTTFQDQYIQNGQAFFVTGAAPGAVTMKINEDDKGTTASQTAVFRTNGGNMETMRINLNAVPQNASPQLIDGVLVNCHQSYSNYILSGEDGAKFFNFNESISLVRNGSKFAIEGRPLLDHGDTISIGLDGMRQRNYQLEILPAAFNAPGLSATLYDSYLNTTTPVSLSGSTVYSFTVSAAVASGNDNRFFIVFTNTSPLDVRVLTLKAYKQSKDVNLSWNISSEEGVKSYHVESSEDGRAFAEISRVSANSSTTYSYTDETYASGARYYRIKAMGDRGGQVFSRVVQVLAGTGKPSLSVFPQPVNGDMVGIRLSGVTDGLYSIRITGMSGQLLISKEVSVSAQSEALQLDVSTLPPGTYSLSIFDQTGIMTASRQFIRR